ncbi:MAG: hypothetical protein ACR2KQ_09475 [Actinomycetota bacterium]
MNDLERLIKESLEGAGHSYSPSDEHSARARFIQRRKRRRAYWFTGTAAATAMAVAVALFVVPGRVTEEAPIQVAARPLAVVETIEVGGAPASIVSDGTAVWVSNTAGSGVVRIDPETNEFENVLAREGQTPDELAVTTSELWGDDLWVTTEEGVVTRLDSSTGEILGDATVISSGQDAGPVFLDAVAGKGVLWAVEPRADGILRFRGSGKLDVEEARLAEGLTDIASDGDRLWGLAEDGGVHRFTYGAFEIDASDLVKVGEADAGRNADLAAGLGYVWVSSGDDSDLRIFRIDPAEEEVLEIPLEGGRYADLTVADGRLWVLAGGGDESLLYRVTADGAIEGEPLRLPGTTNDIAVGAGSAWVADTEAGTVLRISEASEEEGPEPVPTEPADGAQSSAQPFFAYSANGDIYVELTDGTNRQITMSPDEELNPTFLLDDSLVFERHDYETDWWGLVRHDPATGEESSVPLPDGWEGGAHPAVSMAGDLAVALTRGEVDTILVWPGYFTEQRADGALEVPLPEGLSDPRGLIFSDDAKVLYYQAIGEGWVTVQLPWQEGDPPTPFVLNGVNDQPPGTTYVQPEDPNEQGFTVLDVCCRETEGDPYSQFRIAEIAFTEGGATHQSVSGPVALDDADPGKLSMISLHGAVLNVEGEWDLFVEDGGSWLVTDGTRVWLLNRDGGGQMMPETLAAGELSGFSVNPVLEVVEDS